MSRLFASIVLNLPLNRVFHYGIPEDQLAAIAPGKRVNVPFGRRKMIGYCVGTTTEPNFDPAKIKDLETVLDPDPLLSEAMLKWTHWISQYYGCSWGQVLDAALPAALKKRKKAIKDKLLHAALEHDESEPAMEHGLTDDQQKALEKIDSAVADKTYKTFVLHGVTGSGKTEVYIRAIESVIAQGRQALVLVPEIALTPQTIRRFATRFKNIAVMHSHLTGAQRADQWQQVYQQKADVIIGARSCIFAPVAKLGMIIIDEEHESSFKQDEAPRYHARDCAVKRAHMEGAVVILGSATPALETYQNCLNDKYTRLPLPTRANGRPMPPVSIVDMREQYKQHKHLGLISKPLDIQIQSTLNRSEQIILFINRRGFSTALLCPQCGHVPQCPSCDIALTYHKDEDSLLCHYCNYTLPAPNKCVECHLEGVKYLGSGTQRIEQIVKSMYPDARVQRIDSDVTSKRQGHESILEAFRHHDIDILIGTQMIAKGLDFPNVTLVGVIAADGALHLPDFRSAERTFALISQVAGRAGRGEKGGQVIVQAMNPDHFALSHCKAHDFDGFAKEEIGMREAFHYPPFARLMRILVRGKDAAQVANHIQGIYLNIRDLPEMRNAVILQPCACPIARLRTDHRFHMIIKAHGPGPIQKLINNHRDIFESPHNVHVALDVDPAGML